MAEYFLLGRHQPTLQLPTPEALLASFPFLLGRHQPTLQLPTPEALSING